VTRLAGLLFVCVLAATAPLLPLRAAAPTAPEFAGWPAELDGRALHEQPLDARERRFAEDFPGRIATFTDGRRRVLLRWIVRPSRQLHPASDCLRGVGYEVEPLPLVVDAERRVWGASTALDGERRYTVRERIVGADGQSFTDVSSWYWSALLGKSEGPWLAWTVFERE
jgi:hypothetical protein